MSFCILVIVAVAIQQCVPHFLVCLSYDLVLNFISGFMPGESTSVGVPELRHWSIADSLLISRGTVSMGKIYIPVLIVTLSLHM
jgi:hypothetical protein